jgi:uncharacterized damage-inducible protein DinB
MTTAAPTSIKDALLAEYDHEMTLTRQHLERVPNDKLDWSPHEKSMTLGRLASHLAETPVWAPGIIEGNVLDFDSPESKEYKPPTFGSRKEILKTFDEGVAKAKEIIGSKSDADLLATWTMKKGDMVFAKMPKVAAVQAWLIKHVVHHRGQFSVYLRMCDVPVPMTYGPSADDTGPF